MKGKSDLLPAFERKTAHNWPKWLLFFPESPSLGNWCLSSIYGPSLAERQLRTVHFHSFFFLFFFFHFHCLPGRQSSTFLLHIHKSGRLVCCCAYVTAQEGLEWLMFFACSRPGLPPLPVTPGLQKKQNKRWECFKRQLYFLLGCLRAGQFARTQTEALQGPRSRTSGGTLFCFCFFFSFFLL